MKYPLSKLGLAENPNPNSASAKNSLQTVFYATIDQRRLIVQDGPMSSLINNNNNINTALVYSCDMKNIVLKLRVASNAIITVISQQESQRFCDWSYDRQQLVLRQVAIGFTIASRFKQQSNDGDKMYISPALQQV